MPYIPRSDRRRARVHPANVGELTYALTKLALDYGHEGGNVFRSHAEVIAALECAKLEYYARVVRPYEDKKRLENGEVYP